MWLSVCLSVCLSICLPFLTCVVVGHVAFGQVVSDYATLWDSTQTMFRMAMGDFDYAVIADVHSTVAPAFFMSYMLIMVLILVNVFLAIGAFSELCLLPALARELNSHFTPVSGGLN